MALTRHLHKKKKKKVLVPSENLNHDTGVSNTMLINLQEN